MNSELEIVIEKSFLRRAARFVYACGFWAAFISLTFWVAYLTGHNHGRETAENEQVWNATSMLAAQSFVNSRALEHALHATEARIETYDEITRMIIQARAAREREGENHGHD